MILVTNTVIENVRMGAAHQRDVEGLIILRFGNLAISRLTLRSSGTVGLGLGVGMGELALTDSSLYDLQSAASLYVGSTIGSMAVNNVNVTQGETFPLGGQVFNAVTMYFSALSSLMKIRNLRVFHRATTRYNSPNILYATFAVLDVSGIYVQGLKIDAIGHLIDVQGSISNLTILDCTLVFSICYLNNFEWMRISGVLVRDSSIGVRYGTGLFAATPRLRLECADFSVYNVTAHYFVASKKAFVSLRNVTIAGCHFQYLLKYQVDSDVYIENMSLRKSVAVLAFLYRRSLRIVDSVFEDFSSASVIIGGERVNITLDRVAFKNAASPSGFGRFREKSQVTISHSTFFNYQSTTDEGFSQDTGSLNITDSSFRSFSTVFIQARSGSMYIGNSAFQDGGRKALSRTSASAYGGALACTDCRSVVVERSSFLNVSAVFGGAIAVRAASDVDSAVRISACEFQMCKAAGGGAIYVKASALVIEKSKFIGNEAVSTGGALDLYMETERSSIRNCVFYRNSAHEGGAVKWAGAKVSLFNVSFQDNSAAYGPDVASFGVALLGSVTSASGTVASGSPLQLVFELQDHYGQRVATASSQYFQLSPSSNVGFFGNVAATINQGIFNFSELIVYASPDSRQIITGVMVQDSQRAAIDGTVDVTFRNCVSGEVRKADRCEYCFAGSVSFHPSEESCSFCPLHAFCPGGNVVLVDSGYWRNSTNSTDIVACPLRANCLGGERSECAEGYAGQTCNECSQDYTRLRTIECEPCSPRFLQWLKVLLVAVPVGAFSVAVNFASGLQYFMLKRIINHAQLISTLGFLRVSYPTAIKYSFHSLTYVSSLFLSDLPISCFYPTSPERIKALIGSAIPALLCFFLVFLNKSNMKKAWILCTSAVMFTPAMSLSSQLPLLACQSVQSEGEYLFVDLQQECWKGDHSLLVKTLIIPSVIINVILPFFLVLTVSVAAPARFDALFPLWQSGVKWRCWDLLMYCAKVLLTCLFAVSIPADQLSTVAYALLVLVVVGVTEAGAGGRAYVHWKLFALLECSLVLVGVTIYLCAFFIYHLPTQGVNNWIVTALFLLLNAGYFAACIQLWSFPPILTEPQQVASSCQVSAPPNSVESFSLSQDQP